MSFLWHGLTDQGAQVPVQVDAQGRVVAVDGTPGVSNWDRTGTTLSPAVPGDSVDIGSGSITLNASGSATFASNVESGPIDPTTSGASGARLLSSGVLQVQKQDVSATDNQTVISYVRGTNANVPFSVRGDGETRIGGITSAPNITLKADGTGTFAGDVNSGAYDNSSSTASGTRILGAGGIRTQRSNTNPDIINIGVWAQTDIKLVIRADGRTQIGGNISNTSASGGSPNVDIKPDGTATFTGNITAPNVTFRSADPQFYVKKSKNKDALPEYVGPELDLLAEIARLEALVRHLYETLRLAPPTGWPVWDGNDDVLRQLRK